MRVRRATIATILSCVAAAAGDPFRLERRVVVDLGEERMAGVAFDGNVAATWGDRIRFWTLPDFRSRTLPVKPPILADGGCLLDVDRDGQLDLIANESAGRHALVWFSAIDGQRHEIDHGIEAHEILPATLFGRRGVLLVQKRVQVRFYEVPARPNAAWAERDIYSFYSASDQGGLLLADIDRDGRPDIVCGNYWIKAPEEFDLPWRLFAIRTWAEERLSAMTKVAWSDLFGTGIPNLVVSQCEMKGARVAWFERVADPKQMWKESRLDGGLSLTKPHVLEVADFDGAGRPDILVIEYAGSSRVIVFQNEGEGKFIPLVAGKSVSVVGARIAGLNADRRPDLLIVERSAMAVWENHEVR
ncbi:MAG: VCBS repeat-containing protein [Bryobacteraceae bacterium]